MRCAPLSLLLAFLFVMGCSSPGTGTGGTGGSGTGGSGGSGGTDGGGMPCVEASECDDGVACTEDTCDLSLGCMNMPVDAFCDDELFCNGAEVCDVINDCQAGSAPLVDDGVGCTDDSCDEDDDIVVNVVNHSTCDDFVACTDDLCDPVADCQNTANDAHCDDGLFCNGAETCDAVNDCQAGVAPTTDDGVSCTDDSCDEVNDVVVNAANDANCDDGAWCNGAETCDAVNDCQGGTAPTIDDGVDCTEDSCDEVNDVIVNAVNHSNCDDSVACTDNICDPVNDCQYTANNANCDDGDFCTGDTCNAGTGCEYADICDGDLPPYCSGSSGVFSDSPGSAIPDHPAAPLEATLAVSGLPLNLWSITVTTNITHTYNDDLEITLISPKGSRVALSTDNGGSNDDVFAGTVWQDTAGDPVTDHSFSDSVAATPLTPEAALTGLRGEDPNGTWTLEIHDDAGSDTGTLVSWSLDIEATDDAPSYTSSSVSGSPGSAISDAAPVVDTLNVPNSVFLCGLVITTDITHTYNADLDITIADPNGTSTILTTDNGGNRNDVFSGTSWDDSVFDPATDYNYSNNTTATPLTPEGALGAFSNADSKGDWTITIVDDAGGDSGTLNSWGLDLLTCSCTP